MKPKTERCYYCGGPLFPDGGAETDDGKPAHAICESKGAADPDMNPEAGSYGNRLTATDSLSLRRPLYFNTESGEYEWGEPAEETEVMAAFRRKFALSAAKDAYVRGEIDEDDLAERVDDILDDEE